MLPMVFPVVGITRVRDTWNSPRGGGTRLHEGVDLPAAIGTPVRATTPGRITHVWREGPRGEPDQGNALVVLDPDGWYHMYAHLRDAPSRELVGTEVTPGQVLGAVGNTGNARNTGPHLHYHMTRALRRGAPRLDPTARLIVLHGAFERVRAARGEERRQDPSYETDASYRGRGVSATRTATRGDLSRAVEGIGDNARPRAQWQAPITEEELTAGVARDADDAIADAIEASRRNVMPSSGPGRRETERAPAAPIVGPRIETREAIEQARIGVRAARDMVDREVEELEKPSLWTFVLGLVEPEQAIQIRAMADTLAPMMRGHVNAAAAAEREAEGGNPIRWLDAFDHLLSAHLLAQSVASPIESLRASYEIDPIGNPESITPGWLAIRALIETLATASLIFEELRQGFSMVQAVVAEGLDDVAEVANDAGTGFGIAIGLVVVGGLAWALIPKGR